MPTPKHRNQNRPAAPKMAGEDESPTGGRRCGHGAAELVYLRGILHDYLDQLDYNPKSRKPPGVKEQKPR